MVAPTTRARWRHPLDGILAGVAAMLTPLVWWWQPAEAWHVGLLPWILATMLGVLLVGLPMLWLEGGCGACLQSSLTLAMRRTGRRWQWSAWWGFLLLLAIAAVCLATMALALPGAMAGAIERWDEGIGATEPTAIEPAIPAALLGLAVLGGGLWLVLRGGMRALGRALRGGLLLGTVVAIAALLVLLDDAGARSAMHVLLLGDGRAVTLQELLVPTGRGLVTGLCGLGVHTAIASLGPRDADIGALAPVTWCLALIGQVLVLLLLAGLSGLGALDLTDGGAGRVWNGLPAWIRSTGGGLGWALGAVALVLMGSLSLLPIVLALLTSWRDETGRLDRSAERSVLSIVVALAALLVASGPERLAQFGAGLVALAMPLAAACCAMVFAWRHGIVGLHDHIIAYSSLRVVRGWRWFLALGVPLLAGALVAVAPPLGPWAWLGLGLLPLGLVLGRSDGRRWIDRHRGSLTLVAAALGLVAVVILTLQRGDRRGLDQDLLRTQQEVLIDRQAPALGSLRHPLQLLDRAWARQRWQACLAAVELLAKLPRDRRLADALAVRVEDFIDQAQRQLTAIHPDRRQVLRIAVLLDGLGAESAVEALRREVAKADWFPVEWAEELEGAVLRLDLGGDEASRLRALDDVAGQWSRLAALLGDDPDPSLLAVAPAPLDRVVDMAEAMLRRSLERALAEDDSAMLARLGRVLQQTGCWRRLPIELRAAWRRAQLPTERPVLAILATLVLLGACAGLAAWLAARMPFGRPEVDPSAETLERVEAVDLDTAAVTEQASGTTGVGTAAGEL